MDWTNERYVRLYTRDTETVLLQPWQARHIFREMCRKCDRAGVIECRTGPRGLAVILQMAGDVDTVATYLPHLLDDGSVVQIHDGYFLPNFMEANEAPQSDKQRAKESRNNRRDRANAQKKLGVSSHNARSSHETNENVTPSHSASLQPSQPSQPSPSSPSKPAVLRSAAATSREDLISLGGIDMTVAANLAIEGRFKEQPHPLRAGKGKSHMLAELVVNNDIPIDFAVRSIERQVEALEEPVRTMWYFRKGILDDWGKAKDAAVSAPRRLAQNDGVIPIRPQSSPVAPEEDGVVCKICRTKELHMVNGRQAPKHNVDCPMGIAVNQIGGSAAS